MLGVTGSMPMLLVHLLTKNRQRDGGEELGQLWGDPKPHAEQPHQMGHSLRSSLHEEETLENSHLFDYSRCLPGGPFSPSQLKRYPSKKHRQALYIKGPPLLNHIPLTTLLCFLNSTFITLENYLIYVVFLNCMPFPL